MEYLRKPLISKSIEKGTSPQVAGLNVFESAINAIHNGLSAIFMLSRHKLSIKFRI